MTALPEIVVQPSVELTAAVIAQRLIGELAGQASQPGPIHISVTGGGLGGAIWPVLAAQCGADWSRVHVWFSDERFVTLTSPERNDRPVLDAAAQLGFKIHCVAGKGILATAEQAAAAYADELRAWSTADAEKVAAPLFAISILGIGPDGHVASLFPGRPEVTQEFGTVIAVHGAPKPPPERVSFTRPMLQHCGQLWMIAAGAEKTSAVGRALHGDDPSRTPAAGLHGLDRTLWFVDEALAAGL